jgi:outer membrane protein TolC
LNILVFAVLAAMPLRLAPPDQTADALVAEALAKAPEVTAVRATAEAAKRRVEPAGTLPDPMGTFTFQNEGWSAGGLMLSQPVPWPGKLTLASRAAESEAREIVAGPVSRAERTIEARVRNAWYDLLQARAVDRVIDEGRATTTQIESTTRERYAAGLAVQQDVLRAQIEIARIDELKRNQQATIAMKTAEINRLLGRPQDAPIVASADLPLPSAVPGAESVLASVVAQSPEVAAARQGIETNRLNADLARKNFLPDFVVSGGSMYRRSPEMDPMWQVGVSVSIPAWIDRRQRNQVAEAEARVTARSAEADVIAQQLELRTRQRLAQLAASDDVVALYRDRILALDELSLESAMASYTAGKVPFVTVLDALNALYNDRAAYRARLAESAKWRVAIDEASLDSTSVAAPAPGMSSPPSSNSSSMSSMR